MLVQLQSEIYHSLHRAGKIMLAGHKGSSVRFGHLLPQPSAGILEPFFDGGVRQAEQLGDFFERIAVEVEKPDHSALVFG